MVGVKKIPEIRFKGFGGNILSVKLKEVVISNTYGPRFNANDYDINGNVKTIRGTDISSYGNILYHQVPIARLDANFIKSHILEDGDLVMITTADCGLTGIFEEQVDKYIGSAYAVKITLNKTLALPHYFKYFFQTTLAKNEVNKFIRKATVANLPASGILKITHRLPSRQEQEKITLFLTSLYKLIAQHQQKHEKLLNLKKSLLEKMFPKQGAIEPEVRFKGFSGAWEEKFLGEIGSLKNGMNFNKEAMGHGHPFVNLQNVFGKNEVSNGSLGLAFSTVNQRKEYSLNVGDVLFIRSSVKPEGVGEAAVISVRLENTTYSGFIIRFRPSIEMDVNFNRFVYSTTYCRKQILGSSTSSANSNINQESLQRIQLNLPCKDEQKKIGNLLKQLDILLNQHQAQLKKLNNIKQACLEKMFV